MTSKQLRAYLKSWIEKVLVTDGGYSVNGIISSNDNGPNPGGTYLTIQYSPSKYKVGGVARGELNEDGERTSVNDIQADIEIRETNGEGDLLNELVNSLDREDIYQTYFTANGLVCYEQSPVMPIPRILDDDWIRESRVELNLAFAESISEEFSWIETVPWTASWTVE
jgi:hypothetical protein